MTGALPFCECNERCHSLPFSDQRERLPFYAIKSGNNNIPLWLSATSPNLGEEYMGYLVERSDLSPLTGGGAGVGNTLGHFAKAKLSP